MKEIKIDLDCGVVTVRGFKVKEGRELSGKLAELERTHKDDPVKLKSGQEALNVEYIQKCITSPKDLDVNEISMGDFNAINKEIMRLSGGGDVEKKS